MPFASDTVTVVPAGGVRSRLNPLTQDRAKPAVPFGGQYKIIDFNFPTACIRGFGEFLG